MGSGGRGGEDSSQPQAFVAGMVPSEVILGVGGREGGGRTGTRSSMLPLALLSLFPPLSFSPPPPPAQDEGEGPLRPSLSLHPVPRTSPW